MATKKRKKAKNKKAKTKNKKPKLVNKSRKIKTKKRVGAKKSATKKRSKKSRIKSKLNNKKKRKVKKMSTETIKAGKSPLLDTSHLKVKFPFKEQYGNFIGGKFVKPKSGKYFVSDQLISNIKLLICIYNM